MKYKLLILCKYIKLETFYVTKILLLSQQLFCENSRTLFKIYKNKILRKSYKTLLLL